MGLATENQFAEHQVLNDVSEWTGKGALVSLVLDVASTVDWREEKPESSPAQGTPRPQVLLTLLTYCYATGRFSSDEIERATGLDPILGYLCAGARPCAEQMRHFRRRHRALIAHCLGRVLLSAWQFRLWLGLSLEEGEALPEWLGPDTWSDAEAAAFFERAAERRVHHAVMLDSTAMDD